MSSNYTQNYRLCQWEEDDTVRRVDFNEDNAKIDAALKAAADARTAEASTRAAAVAALNAAVAQKGNCQIETFTYTGNGEKVRTISFSSVPKLIIIIGIQLAAFISGNSNVLFTLTSGSATVPYHIATSWDGSQLSFSVNNTVALMNISGYLHTVVAFYNKS